MNTEELKTLRLMILANINTLEVTQERAKGTAAEARITQAITSLELALAHISRLLGQDGV